MQNLIQLSRPLALNFDLTPVCNYHCPFCYTPGFYGKKQHPPLARIKHILSILARNAVTKISLLGGEPTIYPHLPELLEWMGPRFTTVTIVTNGSNCSKRLLRALKKVNGALCVSIHGMEGAHDQITGVKGSFKKAIAAVKNAIAYHIPTLVSFTATTRNIDSLYPFAKMLKWYAIEELVINRYSPAGKSLENKRLLLSLAQLRKLMRIADMIQTKLKIKTSFADTLPFCVVGKKYHKYIGACLAGTVFGAIDFEGNLKLCPHSPKPLGNILKTPVQKLWNCKKMKQYRSLSWLPKKCKECRDLERCNCGCHLSNFAFDRKEFGPDYYYKVKQNETKG